MATTEAKTAETKKDNRVPVFIPKGYANDDPNLFVSVNGKNYLLPKGKESLVPPEVKAEIDRSRKAEEAMDAHIEQMTAAASK
jgi:hypothetical protein